MRNPEAFFFCLGYVGVSASRYCPQLEADSLNKLVSVKWKLI